MFSLMQKKSQMVTSENALKGRSEAIPTAQVHFLSDRPLKSAVPEGMEEAMFGMGCFWGVERIFWQINGGLADVGWLCGWDHAECHL